MATKTETKTGETKPRAPRKAGDKSIVPVQAIPAKTRVIDYRARFAALYDNPGQTFQVYDGTKAGATSYAQNMRKNVPDVVWVSRGTKCYGTFQPASE